MKVLENLLNSKYIIQYYTSNSFPKVCSLLIFFNNTCNGIYDRTDTLIIKNDKKLFEEFNGVRTTVRYIKYDEVKLMNVLQLIDNFAHL